MLLRRKGQGHSNVNTGQVSLGGPLRKQCEQLTSTMESDERWGGVSDEDLLMVDLAADYLQMTAHCTGK